MQKFKTRNTHRNFYINKNGELYVQFRPDHLSDLSRLRYLLATTEKLSYAEKIGSKCTIMGTVTNVTKSGIILTDWRITK